MAGEARYTAYNLFDKYSSDNDRGYMNARLLPTILSPSPECLLIPNYKYILIVITKDRKHQPPRHYMCPNQPSEKSPKPTSTFSSTLP